MRRVLLVLAVTVGVMVTAGSAGADQSYSDPMGDAGVATDIVTLAVEITEKGRARDRLLFPRSSGGRGL